MINLKNKLAKQPSLKCVVGLKDATQKELQEIKVWLRSKSIRFNHKTKGLPFNGVLQINT